MTQTRATTAAVLVALACSSVLADESARSDDNEQGPALTLAPTAGVAVITKGESAEEEDAEAARQRRLLYNRIASGELKADLRLVQPEGENADQPAGRQRSWELPPVTVEGLAPSSLREEERIGSYAQPRWTATRRFPSTRVYVIPEGKVEVEAWARATISREDGTDWRTLQEIEIGLPHRFQVDIYFRQDTSTSDDQTKLGAQFELRYALADWGKIWGNPTLYFEYIVLDDRPDKIEPKLLLGGEIAEGWHWGVNAVAELELGGEKEYEYELTSAISRTIIDEKLSLGVESVLNISDTIMNRGRMNTSFVIGPSVQWRPIPNFTFNFTPLIGVTGESPDAQIYFNVGWEF
ncbi:MAG: hypothetical protein R3B57_08455 [Phycisphaerales bacterium]